MSSSKAVRKANQVSAAELQLALLPVQKSGEYTVEYEVHAASDLSSEDRAAIWSIHEVNMKDLYINSSWGWDPAAKQKELFDKLSRFLIARPSSQFRAKAQNSMVPLVAYSMFRFEREENEDVVYCYELQVCKDNHRLGLGKCLMRQLMSIGRQWKMQKVMLTVFKFNTTARKFYEALGFEVDPTSPEYTPVMEYLVDEEEKDAEEYDYEILSMFLS